MDFIRGSTRRCIYSALADRVSYRSCKRQFQVKQYECEQDSTVA
jgi:hypothetical protein